MFISENAPKHILAINTHIVEMTFFEYGPPTSIMIYRIYQKIDL